MPGKVILLFAVATLVGTEQTSKQRTTFYVHNAGTYNPHENGIYRLVKGL